jgi:hypothetical protein
MDVVAPHVALMGIESQRKRPAVLRGQLRRFRNEAIA